MLFHSHTKLNKTNVKPVKELTHKDNPFPYFLLVYIRIIRKGGLGLQLINNELTMTVLDHPCVTGQIGDQAVPSDGLWHCDGVKWAMSIKHRHGYAVQAGDTILFSCVVIQ